MLNRKTLLLGAIAVATLATGALAQTGPNARVRPDANGDGVTSRVEATAAADAMFLRMDANRDGRLTPEDRTQMRAARRDQMFARMDADNNGAVTRAEFDAAQTAREQAMQQRRAAHGAGVGDGEGRGHGMGRRHGRGGDHHGMGGRGMRGGNRAAIDLNSDGTVTCDEFVARALTYFDRIDANSDGNVTAAERQAQRAERRGQRRGAATPGS